MSFPKYQEYYDSRLDWLQEIPKEWQLIRLKHLFFQVKRPVGASDDIVTCFRDGVVTLRKNRRVEGFTNSIKEIGYQGIRKGDLVIHAMDAFAGAIGVSDSDGKSSPVYSICRPFSREKVTTEYYGTLLRSMALSGFVTSLAKGIRERSTDFRWSDAGNIFLPFPSREEQTQIARFLDHETAKIDALIAEQKRLIKLLQEKRQAVISHAVTKGLDPNVPMKDSGVEWLGEVPCHWKIATLRRAIKSVSNGTTATQVDESENTIPVTRIETISSGKINYEKVGHVEKSEVIMPFMLQRGDIILSHINSLSMVGNAAIYDGHKPLAHGMNLLRLKVERLYIDSKWLLHWLKSKSVRQEMESRAKPAINQASISTASIKDVPIPLIPYAEQTQIARFLDHETAKLDELGNQALKSIELMKERRSALISAAVTGKIDVRDWQPPADESAVDEDVQKAGLEASA
jgi:type I restriction enzyme S subunit